MSTSAQCTRGPTSGSLNLSAQQRRVVAYFDETHNDYRRLWGIDRHLGLHCGYFDRRHRGHDDAVIHMNNVLAEAARVAPGERVLDAGCGVGGSAVWLARERGAHVVGVNINPMQLLRAREHARRQGVQRRVEFHLADFTRTGLAERSLDVVWALESMCYAEDKRRFVAEAFRLLRTGGRLVVADGFLTRDQLSPRDRRIVRRWRQGWAIPNVWCVDRFERQLRQVGFRAVRCRDATVHVAPSSRRVYLATLLFYPLGLLLYAAGLRSRLQTRGIASGYYQYLARKRGLGVYCIFSAVK